MLGNILMLSGEEDKYENFWVVQTYYLSYMEMIAMAALKTLLVVCWIRRLNFNI